MYVGKFMGDMALWKYLGSNNNLTACDVRTLSHLFDLSLKLCQQNTTWLGLFFCLAKTERNENLKESNRTETYFISICPNII
jgi:hypothetical protein